MAWADHTMNTWKSVNIHLRELYILTENNVEVLFYAGYQFD